MKAVALTREVPSSIARCELTHLERIAIDVGRAAAQHAAYESTLEQLGCVIERVAAAPEHPDSVFVEDTALVLDELGVVARPGADSRRGETHGVATALGRYRRLACLQAPATLDGGDVLSLGRRVFVGQSSRTNLAGARQLEQMVRPHGYEVRVVPVGRCLHLKSAVTAVGDETILINPQWADASLFGAARCIEVDPSEPHAANALRIGDVVVMPQSAPRTAERLEAAGFRVSTVDVSELAKAEAGVTCCSLIVRLER